MNRIKLFLLLSLVVTAALFSIERSWAIEEVIKHYRGIRSLGMGGVVTTTGMYDESLFGNPATQLEDDDWKISLLSITTEVNSNMAKDYKIIKSSLGSSGGNDVLVKLADILGRNEHVRATVLPGFYSPHFFGERTSFAFGLLVNVQTNLFLRSTIDLDAQIAADVGPNIGLAHKFFNDHLDFGTNVHMLYRLATDRSFQATKFLGGEKLKVNSLAGQGIGLDADFGFLYKIFKEAPVRPSIGASVNNAFRSNYSMFGSKKFIKAVTAAAPTNERYYNVGAKLEFPDFLVFSKPVYAVEMQDIGVTDKKVSTWKKIHTGAEIRLIRVFRLRAGINQGYWAAGLGIDIPILKIDLASYGEELGSNAGQIEDRRYVARIGLEI